MINFITCQSKYGYFIVNRHDIHQYKPLKNDKVPHIDLEIEKVLEVLSKINEPVILDGGANIGLISVPLALISKGQVISFEPQKLIYYALCGNIVLNNLSNITAIQKGLGAENKIMYVPKIDYNTSNDFGDVTLQDNGADAIEIITIDSLKLDKLDFLKLDIEGMEVDALNGAKKTLDKCRPWCWIEYFKCELSEIKKIFASLDYTMYKVDDANLVAVPDKTTFPWMKEKIE